MTDKEADKFNNINLSSDSDQEKSDGNSTEDSSMATSYEAETTISYQLSSHKLLSNVESAHCCGSINSKKGTRTREKPKRIEASLLDQVSQKKKEISVSRFKGPCFCKSQSTKCSQLTDQDRKAIFEHVLNLPKDWKGGFVNELVKRVPIKRKRNLDDAPKKRSWVIYFHLRTIRGDVIPVCKLMFMNTTGLSDCFIRKVLIEKELGDSSITSPGSMNCKKNGEDHLISNDKNTEPSRDSSSLSCLFGTQNNPTTTATREPCQKKLCLDNIKQQSQCHLLAKPSKSGCKRTNSKEPLNERHGESPSSARTERSHSITSSNHKTFCCSISTDDILGGEALKFKNVNQRKSAKKVNEKDWKQIRESPRDLGISYISKKGNFIPARRLKDRCLCRSQATKCTEFTDEDRKAIFTQVWSLSRDKRKDFITEFVERVPVKRRRNPTSKKSWTFRFNLKRVCGNILPVCKKMFMKTTALSGFLIRNTIATLESGCSMIEPQSLFYSKYTYNEQPFSEEEEPETKEELPSLYCQFDDQNNPIIVTTWKSQSAGSRNDKGFSNPSQCHTDEDTNDSFIAVGVHESPLTS